MDQRPGRPRHRAPGRARGPVARSLRASGLAGAATLAATVALVTFATTGSTFFQVRGSTAAAQAADLDAYLPGALVVTRVDPSTCRVSWTPAAGAPAGLAYDVSDGTSTLASGVSGTTADLTTSADVTPRVTARYRSWSSASAAVAGSACGSVPDAPTAVLATPGDGQVALTWTAPASTHGSAVTGYTATATPTAGTGHASAPVRTCAPAVTACTVTGLTNGLTYTVRVTATNGNGTSAASAAVTAIPYPAVLGSAANQFWLDARSPGTTLFADTAGTTAATAGGPVRRWDDRSAAGRRATQPFAAAYAPRLVANAVNGYPAVRFDRTAPQWLESTDAGIGGVGSADRSLFAVATARSTASNVVDDFGVIGIWPGGHSGLMVRGFPTPTQLQGPIWSAASVTAAGTTGGLTGPGVDSAVMSSGSGTLSTSVSPDATAPNVSSIAGTWATYGDVLRLGAGDTVVDPGTGYHGYLDGDIGEFVVVDRAVTPAERRAVEEYLARKWDVVIAPAVPTGAGAVAGDTQADVTWAAPGWDGGSAVTGYTVTASPGGATCTTTTALTCTLTGLTNGTTYTVSVAATNARGTGVGATTTVAPAGVPGAPAAPTVSATATGELTAAWTAPAANGSAVTGYTATATPTAGAGFAAAAQGTCTTATTSCAITGLVDGLTYAVTVTATNGVGAGPASSATTAAAYPRTILGGTDLALWLDGADAATLLRPGGAAVTAAGQAVATWTDKSTGPAGRNDATQATGANRPATTTVAGHLVPSFDGTTSFLSLDATKLPAGSAASTTFVVAGLSDPTPAASSFRILFGWGDGPSGGDGRLIYKDDTSAAIAEDLNGFAGRAVSGTWSSGPTLVASEVTATGTQLWSRGTGAVTGAATPATATASAELGRKPGVTAQLWQGDVEEVLVLSSTLTGPQRRTVEEYLARKWSALITPPAPGGVSATAASTTSALVSWTAPAWDGGSAITTFTATAQPGGNSCTGATSCTITGLTHGVAHTVSVTATNGVGTGPAGTATVTP